MSSKNPNLTDERRLSNQPFPTNTSDFYMLRDGSWLLVDVLLKKDYEEFRSKSLTKNLKHWVRQINPNGDVTMVCRNTWPLHRVHTKVCLAEVEVGHGFVCFFNDELVQWNYETGKKVRTYNTESLDQPRHRIVVFEEWRMMVALRKNTFATAWNAPFVSLWNFDRETRVGVLPIQTNSIAAMCAIRDGEQIAIVPEEETSIEVWDPVTSSHLRTIVVSCDFRPIAGISGWGPDRIMCYTNKHTTAVFEIETGKKVLDRPGTGMVLNKDILMVAETVQREPDYLEMRDFIDHQGETLFRLREKFEPIQLIELQPGKIFGVVQWLNFLDIYDRDQGHNSLKDMCKRLDVWHYGPYGSERFVRGFLSLSNTNLFVNSILVRSLSLFSLLSSSLSHSLVDKCCRCITRTLTLQEFKEVMEVLPTELVEMIVSCYYPRKFSEEPPPKPKAKGKGKK